MKTAKASITASERSRSRFRTEPLPNAMRETRLLGPETLYETIRQMAAAQQQRLPATIGHLLDFAVALIHGSEAAPPPLGLVYATVRRRAIDLARRDGRRLDREVAAHLDGPPCWFDSGVDERERNLLIQRAMNNLPEIYRNVIMLKVWSGLTFAEISEALEIPANTAASRYRYGLIELRKWTKEVFA